MRTVLLFLPAHFLSELVIIDHSYKKVAPELQLKRNHSLEQKVQLLQ